ncbi:hypothetical protein [Kitasatospora camelliae]|uniref:Uncharacterized protein n=1 Tax=Kitasatospora camelliae TaxID=3156397 RepID=A0AAU8K695_9ACTN
MNHRSPYRRSTTVRNARRLGVLATTCLAALSVAVPAGATPSGHPGRGVSAVQDRANTHASRAWPTRFRDTFAVHELGAVFGVHADNRATAVSAGCLPRKPCRSVALSFQVVTMAGSQVRLTATNLGRAINEQCPGCQTLAGAYQFVVSTPRPFSLSAPARAQLAGIHHRLDALRTSEEPIPVIREKADALAAEVMAVLDREAAAAPTGPAVDTLQTFRPKVTMHRHFDGPN